jgi:hypothetical protein
MHLTRRVNWHRAGERQGVGTNAAAGGL